jgi:hypothetical protein
MVHPLAGYRELMESSEPPVMRGGSFEAGVSEAGGFEKAEYDTSSVFRLGDGPDREPPGGLKLVVSSGSFVMLEVMGTALMHGKRCYAQTGLLLFGDSSGGSPRVSNVADPRWPSFRFRGSGDMYWPQTGQSYTFSYREGTVAGPVTAWRDGGKVPGEYAHGEDGVSFTPAHDPELAAQPSMATRPVFLVAATPEGGTLSYTFYVHRSRYAGADLPLGIALCSAAFLLTGLGLMAGYAARRAHRHAAQAV